MDNRPYPTTISRFIGRYPLWVLPAVLAAVVMILGLCDPNGHLLAANDVYHLRQKARYVDILVWNGGDLTLLGILDKFARFAFWCLYYFHGMLPQVYLALPGAVGEYLGFDRPVLFSQALNTVFAAATVVLFHHSLRLGGLNRGMAFLGALLLGFSPLFTGVSRGVGTEWILNACFAQTLLLVAVLRLETRRGPLLLGLAFTHALLSDPISFLSFGAVATAWFLEAWLGGDRDTLVRRLGLLRRKAVWVLPLVASMVVILWNILRWRYRDLIPSESTLFVYPFAKYLGDTVAGTGSHFGPGGWMQISIASFGVWAPVLLPAAVFATFLFRRGLAPTFLTFWSAIASVGFGILFYVLNGPEAGSAGMPIYGYPAYTLVPFLTFLVVHGDRLFRAYSLSPRIFSLGAILLASLSLTSTISYVWQLPFPPGSTILADSEVDFSLDNIGIKRPRNGDRAAGYVARKALLNVLADGAGKPVTLLRFSRQRDRGFDPFWIYAGLDDGGTWFRRKTGITLDGRITKMVATAPDSTGKVKVATSESDLDLGNAIPGTAAFVTAPCSFPVCLVIGDGSYGAGDMATAMRSDPALVIAENGRPLYGVFTLGRIALPAGGTVEADEFDTAFRKDYPSLFDLFPQPMPGAFVNRICRALGCSVGP